MMFLQKILGLASKEQIKIHMGANMKTKILMLKEIPPGTVNERFLTLFRFPSLMRMLTRCDLWWQASKGDGGIKRNQVWIR